MLGHCYLDGKFTFWFYSFHMSLFFFLSGYTFSVRPTKYGSFFFRKIKTLVIPYFFFASITMACNSFLAITHGNTYDFLSIAFQYAIQIRYTLLWYLACLFVAEQILFFILQIRIENKRKWLVHGTVLLVMFAFYRVYIDTNLFWNIDLALLAAAVMCFGGYYRDCYLEDISLKYGVVLGLICFVFSWLNFRMFGRTDWYSNMFGNPILFVIAAISGTGTIISLSQNIFLPKLSWLGKNSLSFFALHRIIIDLLFVIYGKFGIKIVEGSVQSLLMAIVSVVIAVIVLIPVNYVIITFFPRGVGRKQQGVNQ